MERKPIIIAGPCSAESEKQTLDSALAIAQCGIKSFRAGLWKPRTRPGTFEGVGKKGLKWLEKARSLTGMEMLTEVASREHLICAVEGGIDGVWLGARTVANPFAVQEIADTIKELGCKHIKVWVKNPVNPDVELWIGAIERIIESGVKFTGAIHRGFGSYKTGLYRNPPQWSIPIELKRRMHEIILLHDPSHTAGKAELIAPLSQQALDLCFDGLMIETHSNPNEALSDAKQQITPAELATLLNSLTIKIPGHDSYSLQTLRAEIDSLDTQIVELLAKRIEVCQEIGEYKVRENMPIVSRERYALLLEHILQQGQCLNLDGNFLRKMFSLIHEYSVNTQLSISKQQKN